MGTKTMEAFSQGSPSASPTHLMFSEPDEAAPAHLVRDGTGDTVPRQVRSPLARRRRLTGRPAVSLASTIADEVVPLLVLAHRGPEAPDVPAAAPAPAMLADAVPVLARLAAASDVPAAESLIGQLHALGHPLDALYLDLVCPAARHLGRLWHEDAISFADVTIGVLALQRLLHALDHAFCFCADVVHRDPARRALLASSPGEPHGFAVDVIGAFLRRAGWEVATIAPSDETGLCEAVHAGWYAVLGLSDSCGLASDAMAGIIHAARRASQNRQLRVMVGGPAFSADPEHAIRVGADATAMDARHAVTQADALFALMRRDP
jgi:methanogenic corrinoid protein MtbC1